MLTWTLPPNLYNARERAYFPSFSTSTPHEQAPKFGMDDTEFEAYKQREELEDEEDADLD